MSITTLSMNLAGRELTFEHGRVAFQAHGALTIRYGDSLVLCTAMMSEQGKDDLDFFPMTVEYQERYYASGKIKGSRFIKRDGRPSDEATLKSRLIDRPVRPLFPDGITNEVQIVATVFSADLQNDPSILAITGTSAALLAGGMPLSKALSAVKIGMVGEELIIMPTEEQLQAGKLDLTVAGTEDAIVMVEAGANEVDEATMLKALELAHQHIKEICAFQNKFVAMLNPTPREFTVRKESEEVLKLVDDAISSADLASVNGPTKGDVKKKVKLLEHKLE
ncbi:MAG: polyribonucleotide nucleotidyltransferase, partial [Patescibacteria group bacterium]